MLRRNDHHGPEDDRPLPPSRTSADSEMTRSRRLLLLIVLWFCLLLLALVLLLRTATPDWSGTPQDRALSYPGDVAPAVGLLAHGD